MKWILPLILLSNLVLAEAPAPDAAAPQQPAAAPAPAQPAAQAPAQPQAQATPQGVSLRNLAVLPTSDTSDLNQGAVVQATLASLFQQTNYYNVSQGNQPLNAFTSGEVSRLMQANNAEVISLAFIEKERISLFLFDNTHPTEYVSVSAGLIDPMLGNTVTPQVVDYKVKAAFNQLITQYFQNSFVPLPGSGGQQVVSEVEPDDPAKRAEQSRRLFRELATLQDTKYYVGANIGMARFSGGPGSASSVDFGGFAGMRLSEQMKGELGVDFFYYSLIHLDMKYLFPFAEKYLSMYGSVGLGRIAGTIIGPRFDDEVSLPNGALVFGPGVSIDIPLLGANIRGELKLYFGGGMILLGTYGLAYSI